MNKIWRTGFMNVLRKRSHNKRLNINFIKEDEMLKLNQRHLKHDNHTDILPLVIMTNQ